MTKKAKKLGVKTTKTAVFDDKSFEVTKPDNKDVPEEDASNESKSDTEKDLELDQICSTIDKLTLDMFILMQQHMQQKLKLESCMTAGELHVSKSRYIMGHKSVSSLQLPTESNVDIDPSITVTEIQDDETMFGKPRLEINIEEFTKSKEATENETNSEKNIQDPVKWFGVLVPRDLRSAQSKFQDAIKCAVECANTQIRLHQTCVKIKQLTKLKHEMVQTNEE